ncbi:MAG: cyclic nucleotide-binding domain-containing protein [Acidobacteria bacterium]|nr:cyclic nucleotide-binding domain-containing protein [Acidobacteriota bacterium]
MASEVELIKRIDLFSHLDDKIIRRIAEVCIPREHVVGDSIVTQGETGLGMFLITSGKVNVEVERNGARTVVAQLKADDFFGELSLIDSKPRSASVVCVEDTQCLLLTRDSFSKLMNKYPEIAMQMVRALAARLRATTEKVGQPGADAPPAAPVAASAGKSQPTRAAGEPAAAPPASETGAAAPAPAAGATAKENLRNSLVETFSRFYMIKALTRFSVALVGCPVRLSAGQEMGPVLQGAVEEVKVVLFPAGRARAIQIDGLADGEFSATVLRPVRGRSGKPLASHFRGAIRRNERLTLHVPANSHAPVGLGPAQD